MLHPVGRADLHHFALAGQLGQPVQVGLGQRVLEPPEAQFVQRAAHAVGFVARALVHPHVQEQAQPAIFHQLDRVVVHVGAAVARPGQAERLQLLRDLSGARQICGESIVVKEKLLHLREQLLRVRHFRSHIFR